MSTDYVKQLCYNNVALVKIQFRIASKQIDVYAIWYNNYSNTKVKYEML